MRYEGMVYRPPSEAASFIIQATVGCPHNKCRFCNLYKDKHFKIRSVTEIKEDILLGKAYYGDDVRTIFLADGNTILMKTSQLLEILEYARQVFPRLERVTTYGSSQYLALKSLADLKALRSAGLKRIHTGMETGYDPLLEEVCKGSTSVDHIKAGQKVKDAGIELSEYIMVGLGGYKWTREHAVHSAQVLNEINPDFIRLRTFVPIAGSQMGEDYLQGSFQLLDPHDALKETRLLIEKLEVTSFLASDHYLNFWNVNGQLPVDKDKMLAQIDYALTLPRESFRGVGMMESM